MTDERPQGRRVAPGPGSDAITPAESAESAESLEPAPPGPPGAERNRLPVVALTAGSLLLVALLMIPGAVPAAGFAFLSVAFPVGLIVLGAHRGSLDRRLDPRLAVALGALLVLLEASVLGILLLSGAPTGTGLFGLPAATVIQLAGLWLVPLPLVALAYALTFDRSGVTRADLDALHRRADGGGKTGPPSDR